VWLLELDATAAGLAVLKGEAGGRAKHQPGSGAGQPALGIEEPFLSPAELRPLP